MAACAFSTLCVGRHATARTRSLATQWSSSSSRYPGAVTFRQQPSATNLSSLDLSTSAFPKVIAGKAGSASIGDDASRAWDLAAISSVLALAASGSLAISGTSNSYTSAEAQPMATSSTFASPTPSIGIMPVASTTDTDSTAAKLENQKGERRKVQIRRTVRRQYGSVREALIEQESRLPSRFHFVKGGSVQCEASYDEQLDSDILSRSRPYEVSVEALQGRRETMEDEVEVNGGGRFAAVFDGHGGGDVSLYLKQHLYDLFLLHLEQKHWEERDSDVKDIRSKTPSIPAYMAALRQALHSVETEVTRHSDLNFVGSTAVAVVLHENPGGMRTLISANVGDSRAILNRNGKAVELTKDHKPTAEGERKRILRAGGRIFLDDTGIHRVMNLSLSRAIGDGFSKPIVSPEPDIRRFRVEEQGDEFILLASDGLWDVMSSQDAVNFVAARLDEAMAAEPMSKEEQTKKLAEARRKMAQVVAQEAMRLGSADNTSVVMVWLKNNPKA